MDLVKKVRRRVERGILGIPKKKSVLFTFNPRDGEECLSDSEDSDYFPGRRSTDDEDEGTALRKTKRKIKKSSQSSPTKPVKRPRRGKLESGAGKPKDLEIANGSDVLECFPPEILIKIFYHGLRLESVVKFIPRVSRVCQAWNDVATDPMMWAEIDINFRTLPLTPAKLNKLLQKDLSCCRVLSLSGQSKLSVGNIEAALKSMPQLESVDLSDCMSVNGVLLNQLASHCPGLKRLKLCYTYDFNRAIAAVPIVQFLQKCGKNLRELKLARVKCLDVKAKEIFTAIEDNCPNLEILDVRIIGILKSSSPGVKLDYDFEGFFRKLPNLSELYLDGFNTVSKRTMAGANDGKIHLKNLRIYTHGYQCHEKPEKSVFYRMFASTPSLTVLDLSSSNLLPNRLVPELTKVKELMMSNMRWRDSEHVHIVDCVNAWKFSLEVLDLSKNVFVDSALDNALLLYSDKEANYPLQGLYLQSTNVTPIPLISVLENCRNLSCIDLTTCRNLPRGVKRLFIKLEFPMLLMRLKEEEDMMSFLGEEYWDSIE